ncbi:hypothetical protein SAMN04488564_108117 [Lentzea waywayandensis]|uniref:Uncharacterized protein n=1 Tax=Lentzea waywayandensis TaxID=84724 RepID=A0A1I6F4Q0_9PSEU|nr:hypothetical protein [Lentzea waywayandensis]SFR24870.1 hypothetical protein SAMN04488564_108117 [Lentzea waywayandensis]
MAPGTRSRTIQWILLCALFLGVIGMHHVNVSNDMSLAHGSMSASAHHAPPSEDPVPQPTHEMLHLCVAVLCAVVSLLLLAWLLLRTTRPTTGHLLASAAWPRTPERPPPRGGRDLLSSLCVLRL